MTTATTIEKKYVTNSILKNWLTISIKLNMDNKPIEPNLLNTNVITNNEFGTIIIHILQMRKVKHEKGK